MAWDHCQLYQQVTLHTDEERGEMEMVAKPLILIQFYFANTPSSPEVVLQQPPLGFLSPEQLGVSGLPTYEKADLTQHLNTQPSYFMIEDFSQAMIKLGTEGWEMIDNSVVYDRYGLSLQIHQKCFFKRPAT